MHTLIHVIQRGVLQAVGHTENTDPIIDVNARVCMGSELLQRVTGKYVFKDVAFSSH